MEKIIKIKTINIGEIIDRKIDFLSVDTEGFDRMILKNWPWEKQKLKVICIEDGVNKVKFLLEKQGYSLYQKTKYNSIFFRGKEKANIWMNGIGR